MALLYIQLSNEVFIILAIVITNIVTDTIRVQIWLNVYVGNGVFFCNKEYTTLSVITAVYS